MSKVKKIIQKKISLTNTILSLILFAGTLVLIFSNLFPNSIPAQNESIHLVKIAIKPGLTSTLTPIPTPIKLSNPKPAGNAVHVPILMYHYIGNNPNPADKLRDNLSVSPNKFDAQMGYLQQAGYTPITLDTLVAGMNHQTALPSKPVVITFDDGYVDLFINAFPILLKYHFKAIAFIPTGLIGTSYYASWDQLRQMQQSGLVQMEAHSVHHANLPSLSLNQAIYEIDQSKKDLESKLGIKVNFLAYPYGTSNSTIWELTKQAGFVGGLGTWYSTLQSEGTVYDMPRVKIAGGSSLQSFASIIQ